MKLCISCKKEIPQERLEALPETETCVSCSEVGRKIAIVQGAGSMGSTKDYCIEFFDGDNKLVKTFHNARKSRSWGKGVGKGSNQAGSYL